MTFQTSDDHIITASAASDIGYGQLDPNQFGPGYGQLDPDSFGSGYGQLDPSSFGDGYGQLDPSTFGDGYGQLDPSIYSQSSNEVVWGEPRTNANDFNMINETTQDANNLEQSLIYLQQSEYATDIINQAAGTSITFDRTDINADQAFMDGSGVGWNPEIALQLTSGEVMSPALNLASEFAHLVLPGGLDPNATPDLIWDNSAEAVAHLAANDMAVELGEPIRSGYADGDFLLVNDPTVSFADTSGVLSGDTIDTSNLGTYDSTGFDAGSFAADYGVANYGLNGGFDSSGFDSFSSGFDYGSFSADYGIGDFSFDSFGGGGGGGSGGGFSTDNYLEMMAAA